MVLLPGRFCCFHIGYAAQPAMEMRVKCRARPSGLMWCDTQSHIKFCSVYIRMESLDILFFNFGDKNVDLCVFWKKEKKKKKTQLAVANVETTQLLRNEDWSHIVVANYISWRSRTAWMTTAIVDCKRYLSCVFTQSGIVHQSIHISGCRWSLQDQHA